eukprot:CAMPEP_0202877412 /NCGR_PEP_ID=MMETSP1391-20130828/30613_1 /ASSEMBLY_ACC=CAM_ASM_000867 /TAXON_ID=1034604 /ORGANISM="Chlamydomonas leiostraca, Strain SAG 11-49" /LENGTH=81 /DNA_ID=CAMNT_0049559447 /DNA_START=384 /DNA_END=625 /DNA_ORIENTATION=+
MNGCLFRLKLGLTGGEQTLPFFVRLPGDLARPIPSAPYDAEGDPPCADMPNPASCDAPPNDDPLLLAAEFIDRIVNVLVMP